MGNHDELNEIAIPKETETSLTTENPAEQPFNKEFRQKIKAYEKLIRSKYVETGNIKTKHKAKPKEVGKDKNGNKVIEWYLEEDFMRNLLDEHFPGWSFEPHGQPTLLTFQDGKGVVHGVLVTVTGTLEIIDIAMFKMLVDAGIPKERAPFTRRFFGAGGGFYHITGKGKPLHNSNPIKTAVTEALKYAINRMCRIGDDTYSKNTYNDGLSLEQLEIGVEAIINAKIPEEEKHNIHNVLLNNINANNFEGFLEKLKEKEREYNGE